MVGKEPLQVVALKMGCRERLRNRRKIVGLFRPGETDVRVL
jgi:hypothetical protein